MNPNQPLGRVRLSCFINPDADESEIQFLEQLGVHYAYTWCPHLSQNYDMIARLRDALSSHGITLNNIGDYLICKSPNIHLGTTDRDRDIEAFIDMLRTIARLGLHVTTFTWEPDQVWSSDMEYPTRGKAITRYVDAHQLSAEAVRHGRVYEKDELWDNFGYFMRHVLPEAEQMDIRLALHPNDPPMQRVGGVDCLITSIHDYRKAFSIANSKALGMEFCCGCWLEGGREGFGDIEQAIHEFVADDRILITHFRNVDRQLPVFVETFLDDGYGDMFKLMKTFYEADYSGTLIYDHTPLFKKESDKRAETAYAIGYIKALMNVASHQVLGK